MDFNTEGKISVYRLALLTLLLALPLSTGAPAQDTAPRTVAGEQGKALLFRHPKEGYLVAVPPGAIVEHRDQVRGIAMKSRKGYMITLQTSQARTGTPLPELMSRLEQRYLGEGRPWTRKLSEKAIMLGGLKAFQARYEGAGTMVRVIVARDGRLDYAFIFIAPPQEYPRLETDFNWVLQSFRPAPAPGVAAGGGAVPQTADGLNEMISGQVRRHASPSDGFAISYPRSWALERGPGASVVIGGAKGTPAFYATVNIQNVRLPDALDMTQATETVVADLKRQLIDVDPNARFPGQGAYVYARKGVTLNGLQFTNEYERGGQGFRQWTIVLARPDNDVVHIWSYAAPVDRYDRFGAVAGKMLETWELIQ